MFGLLGGLIGRGVARSFAARPMFSGRPLAGLLAGRAVRNAINPRQARPSSLSGGRAPEQAEKPQEGQPPAAPVQEGVPPAPVQATAQPPQPKPQVERQAENLQEVAQERQQTTQNPTAAADQRPVTEGLLEQAPPSQAPQPQIEEKVAPPPQVVNQTDALTPIAMPEESQFPNVPQLSLSGLIDRVGDIPPRRYMAAEDPVPLKPADVKSQARHTANRPDMSFGLANTATSYTPNYSYRRA